MFTLIKRTVQDGIDLYKPKRFWGEDYSFAFLVHPRDAQDIFKKFPFLQFTPQWFMTLFERHVWPVTVSKISGLQGNDGKSISGYMISIPMTAKRMLNERERAVKQIRKAVRLARAKGAKVVGLGALTSSLTYGGNKLTDITDIAITTGHAYTGYNVTQYIYDIADKFSIDLSSSTIAIVGAAGSIGSVSTQILDRSMFKKMILIDLERKLGEVRAAAEGLSNNVVVSSDFSLLKEAHFIIAATNAEGALITSENVQPGTVIVDDAQPSDVHKDVFDRSDALVIEAGAVLTPGITTHFDIGLHGDDINFCCMGELLILSHNYTQENFVIGRATLEQVDTIAKVGESLEFALPPYQNSLGVIDTSKVKSVITTLKQRL